MPRPIRVVFVLPTLDVGGAERVALTLLRYLPRDGIDLHLVAFSAQGPLRSEIPRDVTLVDLGRPRLLRVFPRLFRCLAELRPDILFSTLHNANVATLLYARLRPKTKVVIRESNTPSASLPNLRFGTALKWAYRLLYPRADRIICQSEIIAGQLAHDFSVPAEKLVAMRNPVDVARLRARAEGARRDSSQGLSFITVGRLGHQKGVDRLIELVPRFTRSATLLIVGDGPLRPELERRVQELGMAERILFVGFTDNPWSLMAGADALLLASRWEGLPNVALEALACGTPVIATSESGGIEELARAAPNGAVQTVAFGEPFLDAVNRITAKRESLPISLLPARYDASAVAQQFARILADVAGESHSTCAGGASGGTGRADG